MATEHNTTIFCKSIAISELYSSALPTSALTVKPNVEIAVVVGGTGICRILNQVLECKSGDIFLFERSLPHGYFTDSESTPLRILIIEFNPSILTSNGHESPILLDRLFTSGLPYTCSVLNSSAMGDICRICGALKRETVEKASDWERAAAAHLSLLLISLSRYVDLADTVSIDRPKEWPIAFAAMNEISKSFFDPTLSLASVAEKMYISRSRLSRAFLKVTGETFPEYLRAVRLREACLLLESADMTNEEIATACGIRDVPTFYSAFREKFGLTPLRYKNMIKNSKTHKGESNAMATIIEINESVQKGRAKAAKALTEQAIAEGASAEEILSDGLIAAMKVVGEKFKNNQIFVPEVLMAARAMNTAIEILRPLIGKGGFEVSGKICIGTVRGDLHDIGKNLVKIMMESRGFEVIDLGTDVSPEKFIEAAINEDCKIICLSALLTTTMPVMAEVVKAAEEAGIRDKVKIMVGGAPVTEEFCREIGADCYSVDAASAADAAVELCKA